MWRQDWSRESLAEMERKGTWRKQATGSEDIPLYNLLWNQSPFAIPFLPAKTSEAHWLWFSYTASLIAEVWKSIPNNDLKCRKQGGGLNRVVDVQGYVWHWFWWKESNEFPRAGNCRCFSLSSLYPSGLALESFRSVDLAAFALLILLITTSLGLIVNTAKHSLGKLDLISAFTTEILMPSWCKWNLFFEVFINWMFLIFWILNWRWYLICTSTIYLELDWSF